MFTGVCLSTGGVPAPGGACFGGLVQGGSGPGGCLMGGGVGPGGSGAGVVPAPGVCLVETPPTATAADGTHPTGMHSC